MSYNLLRYFKKLPTLFERPRSRAYIPELDGLRFIALISVMFWHASIRATRYSESNGMTSGFYWFFPHGEVGVLLFFFISGYVVSQPFLNRPSTQWRVASFYLSRFIRIYPPYLVALTVCYLVLKVIGHVPAGANSYNSSNISLTSSYFASLFYAHGFIFNVPSRLNPPIWSLEIEIVFYIFAPLVLYVYTKIVSKTHRLTCLGGAIAALVAFNAVASSHFEIEDSYRWGPLINGYLFLFGILVADVFGPSISHPRAKTFYFDIIFMAGLSGLLGVGLKMTQVDADFPGGWLTLAMQCCILVFLALTFVGAFYGRLSSGLLSLSWIRWIGTMCYSIYLTHIVVMQATSELIAKALHLTSPWAIWSVWICVLIPITLVCGLIFYVFVERPFAIAAQRRPAVLAQTPA